MIYTYKRLVDKTHFEETNGPEGFREKLAGTVIVELVPGELYMEMHIDTWFQIDDDRYASYPSEASVIPGTVDREPEHRDSFWFR